MPASLHAGWIANYCVYVCPSIEETEHMNPYSGIPFLFYNKSSRTPIPWYLFTMRHTYRALECKHGTRSFMRTSMAEVINGNSPLRCLGKRGFLSCSLYTISKDESLFLHYRQRNYSDNDSSVYTGQDMHCPIRNRSAWRYFHQLKTNVESEWIKILHKTD